MLRQIQLIRVLAISLEFLLIINNAFGQAAINNGTRAVFIFDIAKYIDYGPGFADSSVFRIGILDRDIALFFEMGNMRKTRTMIQDKPVEIVKFNTENQITYTQVLYVNKASGFKLNKVKAVIEKHQTLLMTEGYEFRESMINFIGVEGEMPKYSVNEDLINQAGMKVNSNMMFQAIKTKEDWENLFGKASEQIVIQRDTIRQQLEMINIQKGEILKQKSLLDSLDKEITTKEKTLDEKQKVLEKQFVQISKQKGEISGQKQTILVQQNEVQVQKDTLTRQKGKITIQLARIDDQLKRISEQDSKIKVQLEAIEKQKLILYFVLFALLLVSFLGYYIYRGYKIKKEANIKLEEKNRTISMQKDEIEKQRDLAAAQRDQMPVAIHYKMEPFTLHKIDLQKGDAFYIFSDGYADQFGGPKQKKFMSMQLRETLVGIAGMPMLQQGERLNEIFEGWRGDDPQIDDVTLIGVRY